MTIKQLIKELQAYPPETEIFVSSDAEGNSINNIYQVVTYQEGDWEETTEDDPEVETFTNGKKYKWEPSGDQIVIFPV